MLQGIGGAFMMPQSLSLLTVVFPAEKRGAAMGIWGAVVALGAVTGPIIGGLIVTDFAWEWVFLINLPVGVRRPVGDAEDRAGVGRSAGDERSTGAAWSSPGSASSASSTP